MRRSWLIGFVVAATCVSITQPGCDCAANASHHGGPDSGGIDSGGPGTDSGRPGIDAGSPMHDDAGFLRSCLPESPDTEGCGCTAGEAPRACWPYMLDPSYRGVGLCSDGLQECAGTGGEFAQWTACHDFGAPWTEYCSNMLDDNCDGLTDCSDATCFGDPSCNTGTCPEFSTRPCYDGPAGTAGVGTCAPGTQTCNSNVWGPCVGEVLPAAEDCAGTSDRNCNHALGCWDLFACIASPACMEHCTMPLDPGCVCPDGSGDVGTCPRGMTAHTMGTLGGSIECCPCTASDCGSGTNCCQETVCHGSAWCMGLYCPPLPGSCMGRVNTDCDDFPEDCDEPCCECYGDCSSTP